MRYENILDAIGKTPLVELQRLAPKPGVRIFAKLEGQNPTGSLKDRIAKAMIEEALASGALTPEKIILEPTSGNTGISLAMIGRLKGYRVTVVMPDNVSHERSELLEAYGAEIIYTEGSRGTNGAIETAQELAKDSKFFMPYQYGNPANPRAHYETTGAEILADCPEVDIFVAGLGTGGTLMGVGKRLREAKPKVKVFAVEPEQGDLVQGLRSLDDGFIPPILDLAALDGKFLVKSADALETLRLLLECEGIFAGVSSGAALYGALRLGQRIKAGTVVVLLADGGWKYLSGNLWTTPLSQATRKMEGKLWW